MKIIISGSISNDPDFMEKFNHIEKLLHEKYPDAEIFNPAMHCEMLMRAGVIRRDQPDNDLWLDCMSYCLPQFKGATHIYFIDDNIESVGRCIEKIVADKMGLEYLR